MQNQRNLLITFDTQLKTTLNYMANNGKLKQVSQHLLVTTWERERTHKLRTGCSRITPIGPGLICDINIFQHKHKHKHNEVHTCCISIREVTYASAVSSRKNSLENGTSHVSKMGDEEEILALLFSTFECPIIYFVCPPNFA